MQTTVTFPVPWRTGAVLMCLLLAGCFAPAGVTISRPRTGDVYGQDQAITFSATVATEQGAVSRVRWVSSLDGELRSTDYEQGGTRTGMSFSRSGLSAGEHAVYCCADGSGGFIGCDSVVITVGEATGEEQLFVLLASPREGDSFEPGAAVRFAGFAHDPRQGGQEGVAFTWTSDRDGALGSGSDLVCESLSGGAHSITLTATGAQGETATETVSITVSASSGTTTVADGTSTTSAPDAGSTSTTVPQAGTSTTSPSSTTTVSAPDTVSTTTSAAATTTSSVSDSVSSTTTTLDYDFDCPPEEPIGCIDPDYSTEQYWCCEEGSTCGKVENGQGTCLPDEGQQTSTSTTTTTARPLPDRTTLYLSPDETSDLLFYSVQPDGTTLYYYGTRQNGSMRLAYVATGDGSAVIFSDGLLAVQWILDDLTVAVYIVDDGPLDPHSAYHEIADGIDLRSLTADIVPGDLSDILDRLASRSGSSLNDAAAFLEAYGISGFGDIVSRAGQAGDEQARFIAAGAGFGAAAACLALDGAASAASRRVSLVPSGPYDVLVRFAAGMIASAVVSELGPRPPSDPDDPGVEVLLCRGQSSISQICHYMFFKRPGLQVGPCISLCLTSMRCFTDICMPKTLSTQSAEDFKGHFYGGE